MKKELELSGIHSKNNESKNAMLIKDNNTIKKGVKMNDTKSAGGDIGGMWP